MSPVYGRLRSTLAAWAASTTSTVAASVRWRRREDTRTWSGQHRACDDRGVDAASRFTFRAALVVILAARSSATTTPTTTTLAVDTSSIIADAVRAAILNDPDGFGDLTPSDRYVVADRLGTPAPSNQVVFTAESGVLSASDRAGIEAALAPALVQFVDALVVESGWLFAEATAEGDLVLVPFEHRCQEGMVCGSGGAVRFAEVDDRWVIVNAEHSWIV